ncbi:hypothetical protein [Nonomuraea dietziae]|uniref:hypothetical protein n=1 Tax=Nonomuraea dietziae TaxID=65515 RepID=UPI00161B74E7
MLVLWDKGFDGNVFLAQVAATEAQVLGRLRSNRRTPILAPLADGSYLSVIGTLQIRIIEARVTVTCADGTTFAGTYRLATTLTDARRYPAAAPVSLYHQRWEHESAYYALRHAIMQGRILRSGDPVGLEHAPSPGGVSANSSPAWQTTPPASSWSAGSCCASTYARTRSPSSALAPGRIPPRSPSSPCVGGPPDPGPSRHHRRRLHPLRRSPDAAVPPVRRARPGRRRA